MIELDMVRYKDLLVASPSNPNEVYFAIANKLYVFNAEAMAASEKIYEDKPAILKFVIRKDGRIIIAYEKKLILIMKNKTGL